LDSTKNKESKKNLDTLDSEEGFVLEEKQKQVAIYKDARRKVHKYSAKCTHMGCTVVWNPAEDSFDCPCHGSRFSASKGRVINGPANSDLENWKQ